MKKHYVATIFLTVLLISPFSKLYGAMVYSGTGTYEHGYMAGGVRISEKIHDTQFTNISIENTNPLYSSYSAVFEVDPVAETLIWRDFSGSINSSGIQLSDTQNYTIGFEKIVSLTTTVNIDPIEVQFDIPEGKVELTPGLDGKYFIEESPKIKKVGSVSGNYKIEGPTQEVNGEFLYEANFYYNEFSWAWELDTNNFPEELIIPGLGISNISTSDFNYFYQGVIDGVDMSLIIDSISVGSIASKELSMTPTPIPPAFFLLSSGMIGMIGLRKKFLK